MTITDQSSLIVNFAEINDLIVIFLSELTLVNTTTKSTGLAYEEGESTSPTANHITVKSTSGDRTVASERDVTTTGIARSEFGNINIECKIFLRHDD